MAILTTHYCIYSLYIRDGCLCENKVLFFVNIDSLNKDFVFSFNLSTNEVYAESVCVPILI